MKRVNSKGFTLIELLAVIVIMGILMMVAIPQISRVIENSRKDTFVDTAKAYANTATTLWTADSFSCGGTVSSAVDDGDYFIQIDTSSDSVPVLLDTGGKSSWGNRDMKGWVRINVSTVGDAGKEKRVTKYYVSISDNTHGLQESCTVDATTKKATCTNSIESENLVRGNVKMSGATWQTTLPTNAIECVES